MVRVFLKKACDEECPTCKATGGGYQPPKENNAEEGAGGGVIISLMLLAIKVLNPVYI